MENQVTGTILVINPTQVVSDKFSKREIVLTVGSEYPQTVPLQFIQDKCDVLNSYNVGDEVTIGFNLKGRAWTNPQGETKYFGNLEGWKISKVGGQAPESDEAPF
jgi:hypothetical protein